MKRLVILFIAIAFLATLLSGCFPPKLIQQEHLLFTQTIANNPAISRQHLPQGQDSLFYGAAGDPQKPALIIIHGTPGSWQQYARYMTHKNLLEDFYVVVIDRPGWGASSLGGGREIASFTEQGNLVAALAEQLKQYNQRQPVLLMGHSLGASLAPRIAIDHPQAIDGLLLLAGTLDPHLAKPRWFNYLAQWPVINQLIGASLRRSNQEIFALKQEVQAIKAELPHLKTYNLVVQGSKDKLVYPANGKFAAQAFDPAKTEVITLEQAGHLFPMTRREDIVYWSRCLLQKIKADNNQCQ